MNGLRDFVSEERVLIEEVPNISDSVGEVLVLDRTDILKGVFVNLLDGVDDVGAERLPTPHALVVVFGGLSATTRALDRGRSTSRTVSVDVETMQLGESVVGFVVEDRDVPRSDSRPSDPPHPVFEVALAQTLTGEVRRSRLPEVRRRHRFVDAGGVRSASENLPEHVVREGFCAGEFGPQGRGVVIVTGVVSEPAVDVRHTRDECDRATTGLAFESDLKTVVVVLDVADVDVSEFAAATAGVPRECDECLVPAVETLVEHVLDLTPRNHVVGVGRGVVVLVVAARDPCDGRRLLVAFGEEFTEDAERDAVVAVRVGVVVLVMDVSNDAFGSAPIRERLVEVDVGAFGEESNVPEVLLVSLVAETARCEGELSVELKEHLAVAVREVVAVPDSLLEVLDDVLDITGHGLDKRYGSDINMRCDARPVQVPFCIEHERSEAGSVGGVSA